MRPNCKGISLQKVLQQAFAELSGSERSSQPLRDSASSIAPVTRTAEDRSRMRQKVLEELIRRRSKVVELDSPKKEAPTSADSSGQFVQTLFGPIRRAKSHKVTSRSALSDVRKLVAEVYRSLFFLLPEDYVIIDPDANAEFIGRCRLRGAAASEFVLNKALLNIRKAGWNAGISRKVPKAPDRALVDAYAYSAEIAASVLQRECVKNGSSLPTVDRILCDPTLRQRFDQYAKNLFLAADALTCRFSLLAFRKSGRGSAVGLTQVSLERSLFATLDSLDPKDLPEAAGIYRIVCKNHLAFVGSTLNLRSRICSHLKYGGTELLPETIPFRINGPLSIDVYKTPSQWQSSRLDVITHGFRVCEHPPLNFCANLNLFERASDLMEYRAAAS